ncbi:MAG: hypothetical protein ACI9SE_000973 [Neolewinella sp.]|jgi:hypothetical protein
MRNPTNRCAIVQHSPHLRGYVAGVTDSPRIEDVLHRVNNLLGTIEIQSEVARMVGTADALTEAIDHIVESARKTRAELDELRSQQKPGDA